jgi:hypothetical protein
MTVLFKILMATAASLAISLACQAQNNEEPRKDPEADKYEWRIRQQTLHGTYIPKDLNEVLLELNKKMDDKAKHSFKSVPEEEAPRKFFFSFGRWMTHNWGLYEGSRLSKYFQDREIHHPDDMVELMIIACHRSMNQKPLDMKALIQKYQEKSAARRKKNRELP